MLCGIFLVAFALPLLLVPLRWARAFQWQDPDDSTHLTVYFGRCLGAVALAIVLIGLSAVPDPVGNRVLFDLIALCGALLCGVHLVGAIQRTQPWTETVEVFVYGAITAATLWVRTGLSN